MTPVITSKLAKQICGHIALAIAGEKAYSVPGVCRRYGLADGAEEEAFKSKAKYVLSRTNELTKQQIIELAKAVQEDYPTYALGEALAQVAETSAHTISELTRRRVIGAIEGIPLSGRLPLIEFLEKIWPLDTMPGPAGSLHASMRIAKGQDGRSR